MRYLLDISRAKKPSFWTVGDPVLLPLETGKNHTAYDLIESELPPVFVEKMRSFLMELRTPDHLLYHETSAKLLPVGVDVDEILKNGATLREA